MYAFLQDNRWVLFSDNLRLMRPWITDEADEEEEEATKGLFSLPFMRRAQEKRKRAAQDEAQQLLAELEGGVQEEEGPTLGRRNFGLQGGVQVCSLL